MALQCRADRGRGSRRRAGTGCRFFVAAEVAAKAPSWLLVMTPRASSAVECDFAIFAVERETHGVNTAACLMNRRAAPRPARGRPGTWMRAKSQVQNRLA